MKQKDEKIYKNSLESFEEMAVHCKPGDLGFNFTITVGSYPTMKKSECSKKEDNPPCAYVYIKGEDYKSRFLLTNETIPQKVEDLKTVSENDKALTNIAKDLIKWINSKPIRSFSKGDKTNWDAMKSSYRDIQDVVNEEREE